jgi:hypothetical protein
MSAEPREPAKKWMGTGAWDGSRRAGDLRDLVDSLASICKLASAAASTPTIFSGLPVRPVARTQVPRRRWVPLPQEGRSLARIPGISFYPSSSILIKMEAGIG